MSKPKLHLDEDASREALYQALTSKGHDVTRTPNEWIQKKASDEEQLQKASEHGRSIFSFNVQHFLHQHTRPRLRNGAAEPDGHQRCRRHRQRTLGICGIVVAVRLAPTRQRVEADLVG